MKLGQRLLMTLNALRKVGWVGSLYRLIDRYRLVRERRRYQVWVKRHRLDDAGRVDLVNRISSFPRQPLISVLIPVFNVEERWLRRCIESVTGQLYPNWELCIADDGSTAEHVRPVLEEYAAADPRVKVVFRAENGHISAASNSALELASGEFVVLLDNDDELSEDALYWVAEEINSHPAADLVYSDEDKIDSSGHRFDPSFKPDWGRDLFYSVNFPIHLAAYRAEIIRRVGGFRTGFEGSQDFDLTLRVIEQTSDDRIRHIPRVLYHWRTIPGSVALAGEEKPYAHERARQALRSHFDRTGINAVVEASAHDLHRVRYSPGPPLPSVSVVLAGGSAGSLNGSAARLRDHTDHTDLQVIEVETGMRSAAVLNAAVARCEGTILCFVDAGLTALSRDWLGEMIGFAIQPGIGAVGAKVVSRHHTVMGTALVLSGPSGAVTAHEGLPSEAPGNIFRNLLVGNYSAVAFTCAAIRRELFIEAGGFDETGFPESMFDVDLCLRLLTRGYRVVYTPHAAFKCAAGYRAGAYRTSGPSDSERNLFLERWGSMIGKDPFYNPNFSSDDGRFSIRIE